jgi:response regulator NasT
MTDVRRVLIAEDDPIVRLDLRAMLELNGFEVVGEARDGEEAIELTRELQPGLDAVIMDVNMGGIDGIEAARRILAEEPVAIVMITGYGEQELVARATRVGVFGYLSKPFKEADLMTAIEIALARHAELRELADFRQLVEKADEHKLFPSYVRW